MKSIQKNFDLLNKLHEFTTRANSLVPIQQSILFGSQVDGTATAESDVDLLLVLQGSIDNRLNIQLVLSDLAYDYLVQTDLNISPMVVSQLEWSHPDKFSNPFLLANIKKTGLVL